ncbi:hypothetical protein BJY59DRAFT_694946 [Rhodotorula toruloides]
MPGGERRQVRRSTHLLQNNADSERDAVLADMSWIPGRPKENLAPHVAECKETQSLSSVKPSKADLPDRRITLHFVRRRFTDAEYQEFKRDVLEVVVGTNTPFSWVDHPLVRRWVAKWIGAKLPTRNTLTGTLLRRAVDELNVAVGKNVRGKMATLDLFQSYTVAVEDTSSEKKGGAEAYALLVKHLEAVQAKYGVVVVGVCTDSGSDRSTSSLAICSRSATARRRCSRLVDRRPRKASCRRRNGEGCAG